VAAPCRLAGPHRQHRLAAVERLDLRFLVDAQHHRVRWRRDIEPDYVTHLGNKVRVGRELEGLQPMRLQAEGVTSSLVYGCVPNSRIGPYGLMMRR
jgi:hypothetical protein